MTGNVFFSIPFAGRSDAAGWTIACRLLGNTLASILNQTDPEFEVVITGHERPPIEALNDPRVVFLEAAFGKPVDRDGRRKDKILKRNNNASYISSRGGGVIVYFDADDHASRNLVKYIRDRDDPNGYLFERGYVIDARSLTIGLFENFHQRCGSCGAIRFTSAEIDDGLAEKPGSYYKKFKRHGAWPEAAAREGRPLHAVPFPAAVYVLNTSQNMSSWRGEGVLARRLEAVRKRRIPLDRGLLEEFSLGAIVSSRSRTTRIGEAGRVLLAKLTRRILRRRRGRRRGEGRTAGP